MEIVKAIPEDAANLLDITVAAKAYWGYPRDWMAAWAQLLKLPAAYITANDVYKVTTGSVIAGWYALVRRDGLGLLDHLWVQPAFMRQGVGRELFRHAVERARSQGLERLELEADPHAVGFYERMGAHVTGETATDMGRNIPVMSLDLDAHPMDANSRHHP